MLISTQWCELRLWKALGKLSLFLKLFLSGADFLDFCTLPQRAWAGTGQTKWPLADGRFVSNNLFTCYSFRVQINIIKTGPGRESRHCVHLSYYRIQKTSANAGTAVTDGQNEASWAHLFALGCEPKTNVFWPCRWVDSQSPALCRPLLCSALLGGTWCHLPLRSSVQWSWFLSLTGSLRS